MHIEIIGPDCPPLHDMAKNVEEIINRLGINATVESVTDIDRIINQGIDIVPVLKINGTLTGAGRILSREDLTSIISDNMD